MDFTDQDALLQTYVLAAITAFEDATHRTIITRDHHWVLADFPRDRSQQIRLPRGKTKRVFAVDYISNGVAVSLFGPSAGEPGQGHHSPAVGNDFQEDFRGDDGGLLVPLQGRSWPSVDLDAVAPVTIHFRAGWDTAELPPNVLNALLFHIRLSLDGLRGTEDPTRNAASLATFEALASPYRLSRWY